MSWIAVSALSLVCFAVLFAAYEAGMSFSWTARKRLGWAKRGPTFSPGEAVWMSIWSVGWLTFYLLVVA